MSFTASFISHKNPLLILFFAALASEAFGKLAARATRHPQYFCPQFFSPPFKFQIPESEISRLLAIGYLLSAIGYRLLSQEVIRIDIDRDLHLVGQS